MRTSALVRLRFTSKRCIEIIFDALKPEVRNPPTTRSIVVMEKENNFLILRVEAKDTIALRATLNTYLRWINSTIDALKTLKTDS